MKTLPRRVLLTTTTLCLLVAPVHAQDPAAQAEIAERSLPQGEAAWLRYPAISPDGRTIVFSYLGDLWQVPSNGGEAVQVTRHPAYDFRPVWSPDGSRIAFASDRYGNDQVFVMGAGGGEARRLTFHSSDETPYAFTPDGEHVVFGAARLDDAANRQSSSVDGAPLTPAVDLARLLNRKAGRNVLLGLRNPDGSTREVVVEPVEPSDESQLRYDRWVERNRLEVEEASGGRLGYVHVRSMNDASYRSTFEEVLGRHFGKDGVVVDTRFNPGGDLVADLQMFFSGEHFFEYTTDERSSGFEPSFRWTKPSVVLAGEGNYSDGHCFAWAYKTFDMGPLIGMPVPGTCTFGGGQSLLDGLGFGVPGRGVKDARTGRFLENWQTEPDIRVPNEPGMVDQGRDQQLERAIAELPALVDRRLVP